MVLAVIMYRMDAMIMDHLAIAGRILVVVDEGIEEKVAVVGAVIPMLLRHR
jgi:hypothetical protein